MNCTNTYMSIFKGNAAINAPQLTPDRTTGNISITKHFVKSLTLLLLGMAFFVGGAKGQTAISITSLPWSQATNAPFTNSVTLPTCFNIYTSTALSGSASAVSSAAPATNATGQSYVWYNATASNSCIGWLFSSGFKPSSPSIVFKFTNNTGSTITSLNVSVDYRKLRQGTTTESYTLTGSSGTIPSSLNYSYTADASVATMTYPGTASTNTGTITGLSIANGATYTLTWTLSGAAASSHASGIGNIQLSLPAPSITPTTTTGLNLTNTTYGTAQSVQSQTITSSGVTSISVSAPTGILVSNASNGTFASSATLTPSSNSSILYYMLDKTAAVGSYNNKTISLTGTPSGSASIITTTTGTSANQIAAATLTISGLTGANKVYDGTTTASVTGSALLSATQNSDVITLGGTPTYAYATATVGTSKAISASGFTISGTNSGNYTLTQPTGLTANITAKALTFTGQTAASTKTYDGTTTALVSGTAALQSSETTGTGTTADGKPYTGDVVSISGTATATYNSALVGTGTTITYATGTLALGGASASNYSISLPANITGATINKKALTFTGQTAASTKTYDGTTTAIVSGTATLSSEAVGAGTTSDGKWYTGDAIIISGTATATYNSAVVGVGTTITYATGTLTLGGTNPGNYSISLPANITGASIAQATPTIISAPTATDVTQGAQLSTSTLNNDGSASVPGTFAFTAGSTTMSTLGVNSVGITFTPTDATNYNNVTGNTNVTVVAAVVPTLLGTSLSSSLSSSYGTASSGVSFTASGSNLTGNITVTAQTGYLVSTDNSSFSPSVSVASGTTVYVQFTSTLSAGYYNNAIAAVLSGGGASSSANITTTGSGNLITQATPSISVAPIASASLTYGAALSSISLTGGTASVAGSFTFTSPAIVPTVGVANQGYTFTPSDATNYTSVTGTVSVVVNKATPDINTPPTASASLTYGAALSSISLTGGVASIAGSFAFTDPSTVPSVGSANQGYTFTPSDITNYNTVTGTVSVTVSKATPTINTPPNASASLTYGAALSSISVTGGVASVAGSFAFTAPATVPSVGTANQGYTFTPTDIANYNTVTGTVSVTVTQATPTIVTPPSASASLTYGAALSSISLTGGSASVAGSFAFTTPASIPSAGTANQGYTFTPTDATNYATITGTVSVTVNKANQTITFGTLASVSTAAADYSPGATSSTSATNAITYTSSNSAVATIVSGNIHIVGAGTTTITASQAASVNYNAAADVPQSLTVTLAPIKIAQWSLTSTTATSTTTATNTSNSGITVSSGTTISYSSPAIYASTWSTSTSYAASGKYWQFSVTPATGYAINYSSISFDAGRTATGPTLIDVHYSTDAFASSDVTALSSASNANTSGITTFNLTTIPTGTITGTITSRIFGYNASSTGNFKLNNVTVNGNVTCATPAVPTIANASPSYVYDGTAKSATATTAAIAGTTPTIDWYDAATGGNKLSTGSLSCPTNTTVGTYTYYAEARNSVCGSVSATRLVVTVTITKATPTLSISNGTITYSGSQVAASVSGSVAGTVSNIKYGGSSTTPTTAGTYSVTADFAPTDASNYSSLTGVSAGSFTISKATSTPTFSISNNSITYTGSQVAANVSVSGGTAGSVSNIKYGGSSTTPTTAGTYSVTVDFAPTDATNYSSLTGVSAGTFTISKATSTPTLSISNNSITYTGSQVAANVSVSGGTAGSVSNIKYGGSSTVPTTAGAYSVTADFAPTDATNYSGLTGVSAGTFTISKATSTPTLSISNNSITYTGSQVAANVSVSGGTDGSVSNIKYGGSSTVPTTAGTYNITADFAPTDATNYSSLTGASAGTFTINKVELLITADNQTVCYGTSASSVTSAGSYQITGYINSDGSSVITGLGSISYTTAYTASTLAGTSGVTITPVVSGLSATNYSFRAVDGTVSVNSLPVAVISGSTSICQGGSTNLAVSITGGTGLFTVVYSAGTVSSYSSGANISVSPSITTNYTLTSVTDANGCAATSLSGTATVSIKAYWTGNYSSDWSDGRNWCSGSTPSSGADVVINTGTYQPQLTGAVTVGNISLSTGTTLDFNGNTLTINGAVSGDGTFTGSTTSSLVLAGSAGTIKFTTGSSSLKNLTVNGNVTLATALDLYGVLYPNAGTLTTGGLLTLKNTSYSQNAMVAPVSGTISGNVTAERYIPQDVNFRPFVDLAPIVSGGSIFDNWQEGGINTNGYGVKITGIKGYLDSADAVKGFDASPTGNGSMQTYTNGVWAYPTNTKSMILDPSRGYRVLARGNRSQSLFSTQPTTMTSDVKLRATGTLVTGDVTYTTSSVTSTKGFSSTNSLNPATSSYSFVGNPFASIISWKSIKAASTGITSFYYYLDPNVRSGSNTSTYISYWDNEFGVGTNSNGSSAISDDIQVGQGFFIQQDGSATAPQLVIPESAKTVDHTPKHIFGVGTPLNKLGINLWKSGRSIDGAVSTFMSGFSSQLGKGDCPKLLNSAENIYVAKGNSRLCISGFGLPTIADTIKFKMTNTSKNTNYKLSFNANQFNANGLNAVLHDVYLNANTQLKSDSTIIDFTTTNDSATNVNRFYLSFVPSTLPVASITLKAKATTTNNVVLNWETLSTSISSFVIQRSFNGKDYVNLATLSAKERSFTDSSALSGQLYYRIKAININVSTSFSDAVSVSIGKAEHNLLVYPNPVYGSYFNIELNQAAKGNYTVQLFTVLGKRVFSKEVTHDGGKFNKTISADGKLSSGTYILKLSGLNGVVYQQEISIK